MMGKPLRERVTRQAKKRVFARKPLREREVSQEGCMRGGARQGRLVQEEAMGTRKE